MYYRMFITS